MRDLIVILLVALFGTGAALWALTRRKESASYGPEDKPTEHGPQDADRRTASPDLARSSHRGDDLPAATAPPATALAVLEFDAAPYTAVMSQPEIVIGRHTQDDIRIADVRVSRHHARLVAKRGGGFEIHNLTAVRSEPNPMLVNGEAREHADIDDGDVVTLGGVSFTFRPAT